MTDNTPVPFPQQYDIRALEEKLAVALLYKYAYGAVAATFGKNIPEPLNAAFTRDDGRALARIIHTDFPVRFQAAIDQATAAKRAGMPASEWGSLVGEAAAAYGEELAAEWVRTHPPAAVVGGQEVA